MIDVSVVIPTHNRRRSLERTLAALARQDYPRDRFEVIVSVDGSTDDTREMLEGGRFPFALRVLARDTPRGAASARNLGAARASGPLLVFLDDDIEAMPGLLGAHACAHDRGAQASTGYLRTVSPHQIDFFQVALRRWWEAMFATMRRPGHRYTFRDVLTGNCAFDTDVFRRLGGFDTALRCHEDYELGARLLAHGFEMQFVPDAAAVHHECTTLSRALSRKREEGRASVQMVRAHPHLLDALPLGNLDRYATNSERRLRRLVFDHPRAARMLANAYLMSLRTFEAGRLRGRWMRTVNKLLHYWYWRGVAEILQTFETFAAFRSDARSRSTWRPDWQDVDVATGLAGAMALLDARRPDAVSVRYRTARVGEIEPLPGAERLKGVHLKASLATDLAARFVEALGAVGVVPVRGPVECITATGPLPTASLHI